MSLDLTPFFDEYGETAVHNNGSVNANVTVILEDDLGFGQIGDSDIQNRSIYASVKTSDASAIEVGHTLTVRSVAYQIIEIEESIEDGTTKLNLSLD